MSGRGIIFSAPMVRALLCGRKTQTRRLFKARYGMGLPVNLRDHGLGDYSGAPNDPASWGYPFAEDGCDMSLAHWPYLFGYSVGDRLYVRESGIEYPGVAGGSDLFRHDVPAEMETGYYWVRDRLGAGAAYNVKGCSRASALAGNRRKVRPSIHMPRWASRLWLAVTDVRVQRLQDCSEDDAIAEGIERSPHGNREQWLDYPAGSSAAGWLDPRESYRSLWNSLHTDEGTVWGANPWVVAVTFDVHRGNIDASLPADIS